MKSSKNLKIIHALLWLAQILLALAFGMAGYLKVVMPMEDLLSRGMSFVVEYDVMMVRFIGAAELLSALGLILPTLLRILPWLTIWAAVSVSLIMILAAHYHWLHHEPIFANLMFLFLSVFVVWGRYKWVPIPSR